MVTSDYWKDYHEYLWKHRLKLAKGVIESGETHPLRIKEKLRSSERLNPVVIDSDGTATPCEESVKNPYKFDLLPTGLPAFRPIWVRGKSVIVPYYRDSVDFLLDFLAQRKFDAIIELGSGYGQNIIDLYYRGGPKGIPYYAGENTESGVELASLLFSMIPGETFISFPFDISAPELSAVKERKSILIFTRHALEQVTNIPEHFFETLASHAEQVTCVHFEPFGFQVDRVETDQVQAEFVTERGYNTNMIDVLFQTEKTGMIDVKFIAKNIMGATDFPHETSLVMWERSA